MNTRALLRLPAYVRPSPATVSSPPRVLGLHQLTASIAHTRAVKPSLLPDCATLPLPTTTTCSPSSPPQEQPPDPSLDRETLELVTRQDTPEGERPKGTGAIKGDAETREAGRAPHGRQPLTRHRGSPRPQAGSSQSLARLFPGSPPQQAAGHPDCSPDPLWPYPALFSS